MAQRDRNDAPGRLHHVMNRGEARRVIFPDDEAKRRYMALMACSVRRGELNVQGRTSWTATRRRATTATRRLPLPAGLRPASQAFLSKMECPIGLEPTGDSLRSCRQDRPVPSRGLVKPPYAAAYRRLAIPNECRRFGRSQHIGAVRDDGPCRRMECPIGFEPTGDSLRSCRQDRPVSSRGLSSPLTPPPTAGLLSPMNVVGSAARSTSAPFETTGLVEEWSARSDSNRRVTRFARAVRTDPCRQGACQAPLRRRLPPACYPQ